MDVETLQEVLAPVAFCDITSEIDVQYVDTNVIKLFQLAQLLLEYLLYSQEYLTSTVNSLKSENESLKKQIAGIQQQLSEKTTRLTAVRRECHRRRLLLLAQQQLMDSGPQSYHRCLYCPKAFLNASFLAAHVGRRHPEVEHASGATTSVQIGPSSTRAKRTSPDRQNIDLTTPLEKDVRELLSHLKSNHCALRHSEQPTPREESRYADDARNLADDRDELHAPASKEPQVLADSQKSDWQTILMEEHRGSGYHRYSFSHFITATAVSNLGDLVDDTPKPCVREHVEAKSIPAEAPGSELTHVHISPAAERRHPHPDDHCLPRGSPHKLTAGSYGSLELLLRSNAATHHFSPARTMSLERNQKSRPMSRIAPEMDDDDDDRAESDITAPTYTLSAARGLQTQQVTDMHMSNVIFDNRKRLAPAETDVLDKRHRLTHPAAQHNVDYALTRKTRRVKKRIRSTAIQVGLGRSSSRQRHSTTAQTDRVEDAVFLKVKRPYSRSGSSTASQKSTSPKSRRFVRIADGHSREIVIVRTDDEEMSTNMGHDDDRSDLLRSVHLMPVFGEKGLYRVIDRPLRSIDQGPIGSRTTQFNATSPSPPDAEAASRGTAVLRRDFVQPDPKEANEPVSLTSVRTSPPTHHSQRSVSSHSYTPDTLRPSHKLNQAILLEDSEEEDSEENQVSQATGPAPASSASSRTQSQNLSTSVLRYSRLVDQFHADSETLRGLRHEVEQLLAEHLSERGINASQLRISTTQLNDCLGALGREREHLARKHANFKTIRESLSRHVDRLAHAALSGKPVQRLIGSRENVGPGTNFSTNNLLPTGRNPSAVRRDVQFDQARRRDDVQVTTRYSTPTWSGQARTYGARSSSLTRSEHLKNRPHFQRSSPQLNVNEQSEDRSTSSGHRASSIGHQRTQQARQSFPLSSNNQGSNDFSHGTGRDRSATMSPTRRANSPTSQLSPNQQNVIISSQAASNPHLVTQSSDEWDTDSDDLRIASAASSAKKSPATGVTNQAADVGPNDDLDFDLDAAEAMVNKFGGDQRNTNAASASLTAQGSGELKNVYAVKTDDEDVCTVSSINGGALEENSASFPHNVSQFPTSNVAAIHSRTTTLGPRPVTRFGRTTQPETASTTGSTTFNQSTEINVWINNAGSNVTPQRTPDAIIDDLDSDESL
ncbi:unnamed protein product [Dicrocoelium dendriticum]|nr:unnamed protein product [Dicrocoelium dendriticum]